MARALDVHAGFGIDVSDFKQYANDLRKQSPEVWTGFISRLREVGMIVADDAKAKISPFSQTIPSTIKVKVLRLSVQVIAKSQLAGLTELGNAGARDSSFWKHPVFGNRGVWVKQGTHPFLGPAVRERADDVAKAMTDALDDVMEAVASRA